MADNGQTIGRYYIQIEPSTRGVGAKIAEDLAGENAGEEFGGSFLAGIGNIALGTALGNILIAGISMAADGAREIFAQAFEGFADYQQLTGGMDKLFGDASAELQQYAANAYLTAGVSANEYMQQVTGFSASLINSLGGDTEEAARIADMAMRSMSDNANTFGTDMASIQNAYRGFARGNYTMLDNLSLGYAGTKAGMEQLIADANAYAIAQGEAGDMVIDSFADQVRAIEYIQDKQGIAQTTQHEAESTISGSLGMLNASWANFLTGLGNSEADMALLTEQLVQSLVTAASNVLPVIGQIAASAISALPELVAQAFEAVIAAIDEQTGGMASEVVGSIGEILAPLVEDVFPVIQDVFSRIIEVVSGLGPVLSSIANGAMRILAGAAETLGWAFDALSPVLSFVADLIGGALVFALETVSGLIQMLCDAIDFLHDLIRPVAEAIVEEFDMVAERLEPIINGIGGLIGGIGDFLADPMGAITDFVTGGSREMQQLERNADRSTRQMQREVNRNVDDMVRVADRETAQMSSSVSSSTAAAAASASANMGSFNDTIRSNMESAARTTATQTAAMQSSIDGLEGRDVEINAVPNDYNGVVDGINEAMRKLYDKTVEIRARTVQPKNNSLLSIAGSAISSILTVQWGATGGFVDGATLIGAGEAGAEAIVPFSNSRYMRPFARAMAEEMDVQDYYDKRTYELLCNYAPAILQAIPNLTRRDFGRMSREAV